MSNQATPSTERHAVPVRDHYAPHVRQEMAAALNKDCPAWDQNTPIEEFCEKFKLSSPVSIKQEDIDSLVPLSKQIVTAKHCQILLSAVGGLIQKSRENVAIKFREQGAQLLRNPPEGTICRPDIIAFDQKRFGDVSDELSSSTRTQIPPDRIKTDDLTWAQVETTAEFLSAGDTQRDGLAKAITFTAYHLLSRPDRVIVPGFFFSPQGFSLIFTGASGTCHTDLKWNENDHLRLLCEFVDRIFLPSPEMVNPLTTRHTDDSFDLTLKDKTYPRCKLLSLGRAIGRRTTVFETNDHIVPIIKDQYLKAPSPEAEILEKIRGVPGVVRRHDHQDYRSGEQVIRCTIGEKPRFMIRLALMDKGNSLKESQTPEQFLCRAYDLLEIAEHIYEKKVLHRDLSLNNVLFRDPTATEESRKSTFCSVRHLLDPNQDRHETEALLIDFEHGTHHEKPSPLESAGTPLFQARATLYLAPLDPVKILAPGMPDLIPEARQRYQEVWPERLKRFPPDENDHQFKATPEGNKREWYHELYHDVESVFWIFFVWAVELRPDNKSEATKIPKALWGTLVSTTARSNIIFDAMNTRGEKWLDPTYAPLEGLLREMASHLISDLHWVSKEQPSQMADPSYLREVFQRCILNFLFKNRGQPFMHQERHRDNRKVEKSAFSSSSLSSLQVSSRQSLSSSSRHSQPSLRRGRDNEGEDQQRTKKRRRNSDDGSDYDPGQ
jgi:serine/threonine protein kinase